MYNKRYDCSISKITNSGRCEFRAEKLFDHLFHISFHPCMLFQSCLLVYVKNGRLGLLSTYEIYVLKIAVISLFPCFLRCFKNFSSEIFGVKLVCPVYFSITFLDLLGPWNVSI